MSFATPPRKRKTCEELKDSLRKIGRKTTGTKYELECRLEQTLNTNDKGWLRKCQGVAGGWHYLASGAHRHVYKGSYSKGPRKGQACVSKSFKTGSVYERMFFEDDIKATVEVAKILKAFNSLHGQGKQKVYLNEPEVWVDLEPDESGKKSSSLVEPFITGEYHKFNSNTGFASEGSNMLQAFSHFSYHCTGGARLVCDLQGGRYEDCFVLTDPVVCSKGASFGATDLGQAGMENFFAYHRCNEFCCQGWLKPARPAKHFAPISGTTFRA